MATWRCLGALSCHLRSRILPCRSQSLLLPLLRSIHPPRPTISPRNLQGIDPLRSGCCRHFSSTPTDSSDEGDEEEEESDEEGGESWDVEDGDDDVSGSSKCIIQRGKSKEEMTSEAAEIGYRVVGPLDPSENPFKPYESAFAVVQIGSHQFKVSNGDSIFTERLKFCQVNDKLILNRVLMLGSKTQTIIGRPILPDAAVNAVVEEHALDAKVIIFKKKRRKNYRRTKGHRQELTKLRITDIQGIDKSENIATAT